MQEIGALPEQPPAGIEKRSAKTKKVIVKKKVGEWRAHRRAVHQHHWHITQTRKKKEKKSQSQEKKNRGPAE